MVVQIQLLTADDLWNMPDHGGHVELVRGELVAMSPGGHFHGRVGARVLIVLGNFVLEHQLGEVYTAETGFRLLAEPDTVRAPDAAFVTARRVQVQEREEGFFIGPPDLAVEVVSPDDTPKKVAEKVQDFLNPGTSLVWVFYPPQRRVHVHRVGRAVRKLTRDDMLDGEDVLPGFALPLKKIFDY